MKRLFALLVTALLAVPPPAVAGDANSARKSVVIATGEVSGFYFPVGGAVCRVVSRDLDKHGLRCLVEPTSGNAVNLAQLRQSEVDMAVVQSRALFQARVGQGPFAEQGAFPALRAIASLHSEPILVLVAKSAKIHSLADLKGKRVNLGLPQSFQRMMAETLLGAVDLKPSDLASATEIDLEQQPVALCDGRLDAAFFTGIHPMMSAEQALEECGVEALNLKGAAVQEAIARNPYLAEHVIAAETYPGVDVDITTVAMKAVLATTSALPDDIAAQVAKALVDTFPAFAEQTTALRGSTRAGLARDGLAIPLHPGAERVYHEAGLLK